MEVIDIEEVELTYVLVVLKSTGELIPEQFAELPELKLSRLRNSDSTALRDQGIDGWALYKYTGPNWVLEDIYAHNAASTKTLQTYLTEYLNHSYR